MGKHKPDYNVILQNLVDQFVGIESDVSCLAEQVVYLLRSKKKHDLVFKFDERTGNLDSVELSEASQVAPEDDYVCNEETGQLYSSLVYENRETIRQTCEQYIEVAPGEFVEITAHWLTELHERWAGSWGALTVLPSDVLKRLSDVRGHEWRPYLRKHVLLPLRYWPRLPSRENWHSGTHRLRRAPLPKRVDHLLEYAAETDPTDHWLRICRRMDSFIEDIQAIAPELNATVEVDYDPRNEERDRWLYERRQTDKMTWKSLFREYDRVRAEHSWPAIGTNGIRRAVDRFACANGLPLRKGRGGRPKGSS